MSTAVARWLGPIPGHGPTVVPNAVDTAREPTPLAVTGEALFIGRINAWKGQLVFVETARLTRARIPSARFRVVGGQAPGGSVHASALRSAIDDATAGGSWLQWNGEVADPRSEIRNAWVVVVPSTQPEPMPNVVLEAMSEGRAVVGSSHGGIPEMITDGLTGILVPPDDAEALADAMTKVLSDRAMATSMGLVGWQHASSRFSNRALQDRWRGILGPYTGLGR